MTRWLALFDFDEPVIRDFRPFTIVAIGGHNDNKERTERWLRRFES